MALEPDSQRAEHLARTRTMTITVLLEQAKRSASLAGLRPAR
jgi:hypothetical protein